jgi:hypothetical protein
MESFGLPILAAYGGQLPIILAYLVGIGVSAAFWSRHPQAAKLAFFGCLVLLLVLLASTPISILLPMTIFQRTGNTGSIGLVMFGVSVVRSLLYLAGFALLLAAVFAGRSQREPVGHEAGRV